MPISSRTTTQAIHKTALTYTAEPGHQKDGGRKFLLEVFDLIRENKQVGALTVNFGVGGGVGTIVFEERHAIAQADISFDPTA